MRKKKPIVDQAEPYRLWFEYLRVARNSSLASVREALRHSEAFYAPWGNVMTVQFDAWWKEQGHLFKEKYAVRRLAPGELPSDPNALVVEIPLIKSPTVLLQRIAKIVHDASAKQEREIEKEQKTSHGTISAEQGCRTKALSGSRDAYGLSRRLSQKIVDCVVPTSLKRRTNSISRERTSGGQRCRRLFFLTENMVTTLSPCGICGATLPRRSE